MRRRQMLADTQRKAELQRRAEAEAAAREAALAERKRFEGMSRQAQALAAQAQAQADALAEQVEAERLEKERMAAELQELKNQQREHEEAMKGARVNLSASGLTQFPQSTSETEIFEKGVYAWTAGNLPDSLSDAEIIDAIKKRLKYVHATPEQALAACVREPRLATQPEAYASHGVDTAVFQAFAAQLLYHLSDVRTAKLLSAISGALPIISVPRFLMLFGGGDGRGAQLVKPNPVLGRSVERLSDREKKLLTRLREFLFEQHSQMKKMYERCDPDGNGYADDY